VVPAVSDRRLPTESGEGGSQGLATASGDMAASEVRVSPPIHICEWLVDYSGSREMTLVFLTVRLLY
jgi:hypothetical protein